MNKTEIEWCTHSWNPVTGCLHGCSYCYARKIAERFKGSKAWPEGFSPMFYPQRLRDPVLMEKPAIIFCGSMSDVFGKWWETSVIVNIIDAMRAATQHKFIVLTKNPSRIVDTLDVYPVKELSHVFFGTSTTGAATEDMRLIWLKKVHDMGFNTVISFEPLLTDPLPLVKSLGGISWADWVIVGGQTNPKKFPDPRWKCAIRDEVDPYHKPLFIKDNAASKRCLAGCAGDSQNRRMFPQELYPIAKAGFKVIA